MNQTAEKKKAAQGAESSQQPGSEMPVMSIAQIRDFLKKDLQVAINCLDCIYRDQDLLEAMAAFMQGRMENLRHQKELQGQMKIKIDE